MAVLNLNALDDGVGLQSQDPGGLDDALHKHLGQPGPVIVMIHGYKYLPGHGRHCPHRQLFSFAPGGEGTRVVPWAWQLSRHGTARFIGLGWPARGSIWAAYRQAALAGRALAHLVLRIRALAPDRSVRVFAHSLGARVAFCALHDLPAGAVSRMVLMSAAEFTGAADHALRSPAGHTARVLHVTSRENALFDRLLECLVAAPAPRDRALGTARPAGLATLRLEDSENLLALDRLGYPIARDTKTLCHWSPYLRQGMFALYSGLLTGTDPTLFDRVARALKAERGVMGPETFPHRIVKPQPLPLPENA